MSSGKWLSQKEQGMIEGLKLKKTSNKKIAKIMNRSTKVIKNFLASPLTYGKNKSTGRPPKISKRLSLELIPSLKKNQNLKKVKKSLGLDCHISTISRQSNVKKRLIYKKRKSSPKLRKIHKNGRIEFAKKYMKFTPNDWGNFFFQMKKSLI